MSAALLGLCLSACAPQASLPQSPGPEPSAATDLAAPAPTASSPASVAPTPSPAPVAPQAPAEPATPVAPEAKPATSPILPSADAGRACKVDADCAVKDVGSCCGYRPQCLNKDTPTFPERVKAQCEKEGRVSTCGMLAISGCQCVAGKCEGVLQADEGLQLPSDPASLQ